MKMFFARLSCCSRHRAAGRQPTSNQLKATAALPKVAGLQVKKLGARHMPPEQLANWQGIIRSPSSST